MLLFSSYVEYLTKCALCVEKCSVSVVLHLCNNDMASEKTDIKAIELCKISKYVQPTSKMVCTI